MSLKRVGNPVVGWIGALVLSGLVCISGQAGAAEPAPPAQPQAPAWLSEPLSLMDCMNLALAQNGAILKSLKELDAVHGLAVQTRAIAIPKVQVKGNYEIIEQRAVDKFPFPGLGAFPYPDQSWNVRVQLVQSIYEGGRIRSSLRSAKLTKEQALLNHQTVVADALLAVRIAYADVLLAAQQMVVQEASLKLLTKELEDTTRRFDAGTVPRFNKLRAEVELANARPRLSRARNASRIAKNNLVNLLGYHVPKEIWEDLPLALTGSIEAEPYTVELPVAVGQALERRTELAALRKAGQLRQEGVVAAKAGALPSVQLYSGYGSRSSMFSEDLSRDVRGWFAGAQLTWDIFDGGLTKGKIQEAKAQSRKIDVEMDDAIRRIELEVRTAYSNFVEAKEVLESQKKVQEQADEAVRLAMARSEAGTGTQLDVLSAQTSLTEARTTLIQAQRDSLVAQARLERAIGLAQ